MSPLTLTPQAAARQGKTLAVFDFGKTNSKMLVYGQDGTVLATARSAPRWVMDGATRILDEEALHSWVRDSLAAAATELDCDRVMISAHACTFALIADDQLLLPILDYEYAAPGEIEQRFRALQPPFTETGSPDLPAGLNYGLHIYWRAEHWPEAFAKAQAILPYPQFWNWRLAGTVQAEISYVGCHSHLWSPQRDDYSSLVDHLGWREKMPPLKRAGAVVGTLALTLPDGGERVLQVHNGVHDSNASLYFYRSFGYTSFSLISTGTWVIAFNTDATLDQMDGARDMLANVSVDRQPVVTARFMGGREFDLISGNARVKIGLGEIEAAIAAGQMALPSFAPGGPYPESVGRLVGPEPASEAERAAVGSLYLACMTATVLDMLGSDNTVIIDGGLALNPVYATLIASLRPNQTVLVNADAEGTAAGAASLAFETFGVSPFKDPCTRVEPQVIPGLDAYAAAWREAAKAGR
ncbi:Sugar (pentulose or hexulose) kinase [Rhizobium sp. RU20A]|uniref:FGGY-family carbohydrate kinase n=1 Tax=Rhizobium sp. RU20A TaxID=1907412 RepID=UPI000955C47C|nr:carbohydrate kinase [Rhizobium sp. RU20A]SIR28533.1 Sugar (pentulose or hexulose) kinase [Rhizobium sp. RU20A]